MDLREWRRLIFGMVDKMSTHFALVKLLKCNFRKGYAAQF
ncbi:MAG: hypothetical protein K0R59_2813 [Sphingobacterium sp.]|jgi:hypothetical protein|nr:hypothetical protein [Sphingobacterium sp.]